MRSVLAMPLLEMPREHHSWTSVKSDPVAAIACRQNLACSFYAPHEWHMYRLGDLILQRGGRGFPSAAEYHVQRFPTSIVAEYLHRSGVLAAIRSGTFDNGTFVNGTYNRPGAIRPNLTLLHEITSERRRQAGDPDRPFVLHLRVGDVIDNNALPIPRLLCNNTLLSNTPGWAGTEYTRPLGYYDSLPLHHELRKRRVSKLTLVVGGIRGWNVDVDGRVVDRATNGAQVNAVHRHYSNWTHNPNRSCAFVASVSKYLQRRLHVEVAVRSSDPDSDFAFMSHAQVFVPSGGGFSNLVADMVTRSGGVVLNANPDTRPQSDRAQCALVASGRNSCAPFQVTA